MPMNLRLEAPDGSGGEEYRIRDDEIESRTVTSAGYFQSDDDWQPLSSGELAHHVQRNTVVAQWLRHRIGWRRLLLKCTDQDTLQRLGVTQSVNDRFAA